MKKIILNNKGYMLVEIIVASVIAMVMAYFLMDITIKFVDKNNDYYVDSLLLADKALITKEIMDDIVRKGLKDVNIVGADQENVEVELCFDNGCSDSKNFKFSSSQTGVNKITYGNDAETYTKTLSSELSVPFTDIRDVISAEGNILTIDIPAYTNYSKENYGIKIVVPYG